MTKKLSITLGTSAALAALVFTFWPERDSPSQEPTVEPVASINAKPDAHASAPSKDTNSTRQWNSDQERDAFFIADMQGRFAPHIHIQHAQIRLIEQVISYLREHYPDDWRSRVAALLGASFPELADELLNKFDSLERYNEWLLADRKQLQQMSPEDRRQALWDKRYAAFGEDAEVIWAAEIRNQNISDALIELDQSSSSNLQEKLGSLVNVIEQNYGEHSEAFIQSRQTELMNKFIQLPSVQSSLRELPATERRAELRSLRQSLGMDEEALDRWEALDNQRDQAWSTGQDYMARREDILSRYDGSRQQEELYALQQSVFGNDAALIRQEEAAGFYRYAGQRRIGRE
ncbi:hypothetical protein FHR99_002365 [Litorivivens lipolytica]|uniref:Lipase modulator n=1 Tax=Litorivivens lipolytica TaxID=1524264 RepID=A0A7W4W618_9GAMM|nr:hypothetical protein [Litorivivens lipolytica]MBB3048099.1 hypothetical protein [Litorivivens lipolytica]